jgi:hypothetical protein
VHRDLLVTTSTMKGRRQTVHLPDAAEGDRAFLSRRSVAPRACCAPDRPLDIISSMSASRRID